MKIVVAIDSMKGCLSSADANQAAADGVRRIHPDADIVQIPVSDGGEGFIDAFHEAIGGTIQEVTVRDPMMRFITAKYLLRDQEAVIEIAQASGLTLLSEEERNPMVATSYGTGQLIADAVNPEGFSLQEAMRPEVARKNISMTIQELYNLVYE